MNIEKEVSNVLESGTTNLTTANTQSVIVASPAQAPKKGIHLKAGIDNAGIVYVGGSNTNGTVTSENCGWPLDGGQSIFLPVEDVTLLRAYNDTANDVLHWVIL